MVPFLCLCGPCPPFFFFLQGQILQTARKWLSDLAGGGGVRGSHYGGGAQNAGCGGDYSSMVGTVAKIEKLISAL